VPPEQVKIQQTIKFGEEFEIDPRRSQLRRAGRALKLERIPLRILCLLIEQRGDLVSGQQIVDRIWGEGVQLDTDNSINGAIRKIRQVLGDDREQPRFIQTVTCEGYRFLAPVENPDAPISVAIEPVLTEASHGQFERGAPQKIRWALPTAVGLLLVTAATIAYLARPRVKADSSPSATRTMIAVLPFENLTGDISQEYLSDGMTEELIADLGRLDPQHLGVIARASVMHYKGSRVSLDQIGRELGVEYVVEGSVRRDSERARVTAEFIQVKDQTHLWARKYDREVRHVLDLQDEVAQAVSAEVQRALAGQSVVGLPEARPAATNSYEAFDSYLKGRYFLNKRTPEGFEQAAGYFQQATSKDPRYAQAYAGLADTFALMSTWNLVPAREFMPKARAAATKALALDNSLADAHASLALIAESFDYDWESAEDQFRRAIALDPGYATAYQWYAELLAYQGRFDDALAQSERARQLDPLSLIIATDHGAILYYSRQYDRAIAQLTSVLEMDPNFLRARGLLIYAYMQGGQTSQAMQQIQQWGPLQASGSLWPWAFQAYVYGRTGRAMEAEQWVARLRQPAPNWRHFDHESALLAAYIGTDQRDQAIALLQKAFQEHSNVVIGLKVDPLYDPLRTDPRFERLVERVAPAEGTENDRMASGSVRTFFRRTRGHDLEVRTGTWQKRPSPLPNGSD